MLQSLRGSQKEKYVEKVPETQLGFQVMPLTFFPLPRTAPKEGEFTTFTRETNAGRCTYYSEKGVPYTTIDRRWFEIVTTLAKRQAPDLRIEFGGISDTLKKYGMGRSGGSRGYIGPARKALAKIAYLTISMSRIVSKNEKEYEQSVRLNVADRSQIIWAGGRAAAAESELFDCENFMDLTPQFGKLLESAVPHIQEDYMKIQSALTLDVYPFLVSRIFGIRESVLIRWPWIYGQFGKGGMLNQNQMKDFRKDFKASVVDIQQNYYTKARMKFTDEGLILMPSPPLIEPDSKKAGFSLM